MYSSLAKIVDIASSLQRTCKAGGRNSASLQSQCERGPFQLPQFDHRSWLEKLALTTSTQQELNNIVERRLSEFGSELQSSYHRCVVGLSSLGSRSQDARDIECIRQIFSNVYARHVGSVKAAVSGIVGQAKAISPFGEVSKTTVGADDKETYTVLELAYARCQVLNSTETELVARSAGLRPSQVRTWFQNRRNRHRRAIREAQARGETPPPPVQEAQPRRLVSALPRRAAKDKDVVAASVASTPAPVQKRRVKGLPKRGAVRVVKEEVKDEVAAPRAPSEMSTPSSVATAPPTFVSPLEPAAQGLTQISIPAGQFAEPRAHTQLGLDISASSFGHNGDFTDSPATHFPSFTPMHSGWTVPAPEPAATHAFPSFPLDSANTLPLPFESFGYTAWDSQGFEDAIKAVLDDATLAGSPDLTMFGAATGDAGAGGMDGLAGATDGDAAWTDIGTLDLMRGEGVIDAGLQATLDSLVGGMDFGMGAGAGAGAAGTMDGHGHATPDARAEAMQYTQSWLGGVESWAPLPMPLDAFGSSTEAETIAATAAASDASFSSLSTAAAAAAPVPVSATAPSAPTAHSTPTIIGIGHGVPPSHPSSFHATSNITTDPNPTAHLAHADSTAPQSCSRISSLSSLASTRIITPPSSTHPLPGDILEQHYRSHSRSHSGTCSPSTHDIVTATVPNGGAGLFSRAASGMSSCSASGGGMSTLAPEDAPMVSMDMGMSMDVDVDMGRGDAQQIPAGSEQVSVSTGKVETTAEGEGVRGGWMSGILAYDLDLSGPEWEGCGEMLRPGGAWDFGGMMRA